MNKCFWVLSVLLVSFLPMRGQIPTPDAYLGYPLGSQFSRHHQIVGYFEAVAAQSSKVRLLPYGQTNEGRPLMVAVVTSEANMANLEQIRQNNLQATGLREFEVKGKRLPIVWLSYNIHGNEASASEAAVKTLYEFAAHDTANWLDEVVLMIDPCINPDGRDRYVNWYRQASNQQANVRPESWEHIEPWPGGRVNHYLFDLNRDWCWQLQVESRQRAKLYHEWMPQVHVDYHEQMPDAPYFFGPAAEPLHEAITPWQRTFQQYIGRNHAKYFDQNGWLYFTREIFDLLYPSYGDTWPTFQGAIGFTYEQGGHGRAGRAIQLANGDTLRLTDRINHHFTTGWSTVEMAYVHRSRLISEFDAYFQSAREKGAGDYTSYVISKDQGLDKLSQLQTLLENNHIQYATAIDNNKPVKGFSFSSHRNETFTVQNGDWIISTQQPQGNLVDVLFSPEVELTDSMTYDLTAWSIPYAYNLKAYATRDPLNDYQATQDVAFGTPPPTQPYAYVIPWNFTTAEVLSQLLQRGLKARYASQAFSLNISPAQSPVNVQAFDAGTLIINRADNKTFDFETEVEAIFQKVQKQVVRYPVYTGFVEEGKDLGSNSYELIKAPRIAIVGGEDVSANSMGECWYYMEQALHYPISVIPGRYLDRAKLSEYDVLILPSGSYQASKGTIGRFLQGGGKVIAMERAMRVFSQTTGNESMQTNLTRVMQMKQSQQNNGDGTETPYSMRARKSLVNYTAGSIYEVQLDPTHPLAFGIGEKLHIMKRNSTPYPLLTQGLNLGKLSSGDPVSGFVGAQLQKRLKNTFVFASERVGRGQVIYMTDSPIFRGFWHGGYLLMANAIFF
ncbi:MAG: M14 metallopeptidase family protein [Bacteroidota bacterium]